MYTPDKTAAWLSLEKLAVQNRNDQVVEYFSREPLRFSEMSIKESGVLLDYSKNKISPDVLEQLIKLADNSPLRKRRAQMYAGERINLSENRSVLHTALRNQSDQPVMVNGHDVMPKISAALEHLRSFSEAIHRGERLGCSGKKILNVVNIGIGGSDLGPKLVCDALSAYQVSGIKLFFISSVDGAHHQSILQGLNPEQTLFIISSKSFSTQETMLNARSVKKWFLAHSNIENKDIKQHFVAVTASIEGAEEFGIAQENVFEFWDWIGGRYSLWSSIGLPIVLSLGYENFVQLLAGAHEIDKHFIEAPTSQNLPVLLALVGIWNINFQGAQSHAIIPYNQALRELPAFLQQLDMESNGKTMNRLGEKVQYNTSPIVWGQTGSNGQHAFFQLLHQGSSIVPVDFIATLEHPDDTPEHNKFLLTNMLAQAEAFMLGSKDDSQSNFNNCPGNRPSNILLLDKLSPKILGALIAVYEHKVFVQGVIWNVNSFDQWGVQLGKKLTSRITERKHTEHDSSTANLLHIVQSYF
ncbi:MAG: glucose-6-phosphate isomerase [Oceanospirillaceae bacterium]|jgi:glucose-6-phosphate isomerase